MKITIKVDIGKLEGLVTGDVRLFANSEYYRHMFPYIPRATGMLSESVDIQEDGVHFRQPYAQFLYYGKLMVGENGSPWARKNERKHVVNQDLNFSTEKHPLATDHWDEPTKLNHGDAIAEAVKKYIRRRINEQA